MKTVLLFALAFTLSTSVALAAPKQAKDSKFSKDAPAAKVEAGRKPANVNCGPYAADLEEKKRLVADFDRLTVAPMQKELKDLTAKRDYERDQPEKLKRENDAIKAEIGRVEKKIAPMETKIKEWEDAAANLKTEMETAGCATATDKQKVKECKRMKNQKDEFETKARNHKDDLAKLVKANEIRQREITANLAEIASIALPPNVEDYEPKMKEIELALADQAELRRKKEAEADLAKTTYDMCENYNALKYSYQVFYRAILKLRVDGCSSLPPAGSDAERRAEVDARCAFGCQGAWDCGQWGYR